jgi:hypothetical protein
MANNPNPYRDQFPWGNFLMGGILMPGVIESIDGVSKPHTWIYQMGLASMNAVSIWRGQRLAEGITIVSRISDEQEFDDCFKFRNALQPKIGRRPPVLPVLNGALDFVGIKRASVKEIFPPMSAPGLSWTFKVVITEYNPMKPVPVGPADPPKAESENDRLQKEFSSLLEKAGKL